jgi:hypothetical protein
VSGPVDYRCPRCGEVTHRDNWSMRWEGYCPHCHEWTGPPKGFTCPVCKRVSHNPHDIAEGYCGYCHDWTGEGVRESDAWDHPVRFRVWVDGELADETTIVLGTHDEHIEAIAARQAELCNSAEEAGQRYLVEVKFWDGEHVRWGTDTDGMVVPVEVGLMNLLDAIAARWDLPASEGQDGPRPPS